MYVCTYLYMHIYTYVCVYLCSKVYGNTSNVIISSQISKGFIQLPENSTVQINFYVSVYKAFMHMYAYCEYVHSCYIGPSLF